MPNQHPFFWTDENVETCKRLYIDEGRSARETGGVLGCSRNAVIGKAHRMGWDRDSSEAVQNHRKAMRKGSQDRMLLRQRHQREVSESRAIARYAIKVEKAKDRGPKTDRLPTFATAGGGRLSIMNAVMPIDADPVAFLTRPRSRCAWPIGPVNEPCTADSLCCGAPVKGERPYCETHDRQSSSGQPLKRLRVSDPYTSIVTPLLQAAA